MLYDFLSEVARYATRNDPHATTPQRKETVLKAYLDASVVRGSVVPDASASSPGTGLIDCYPEGRCCKKLATRIKALVFNMKLRR